MISNLINYITYFTACWAQCSLCDGSTGECSNCVEGYYLSSGSCVGKCCVFRFYVEIHVG